MGKVSPSRNRVSNEGCPQVPAVLYGLERTETNQFVARTGPKVSEVQVVSTVSPEVGWASPGTRDASETNRFQKLSKNFLAEECHLEKAHGNVSFKPCLFFGYFSKLNTPEFYF